MTIKIGAAFPQGEVGGDPGGIRAYLQALEELGYTHLECGEHTVLHDPSVRPDWNPSKPARPLWQTTWPNHDPFVLFGLAAALTKRVEFITGIVYLPVRQTALVAKQCAEVDVLSNGRMRLGVGVGWNDLEYTTMGADFHTRGKRMEEQIKLLRRLWTEEVVEFKGRFDQIEHAGINPLPVQRPIPIWHGGSSEPALRRAARLGAEGLAAPPLARLPEIKQWYQESGHDFSKVSVSTYVLLAGDPAKQIERMRTFPKEVTHVTAIGWEGVGGIDKQIEALRRFRAALPK